MVSPFNYELLRIKPMIVSIATAKADLLKLIRLAEGGETITIERHGRPVVQIRCLPPELRPAADDASDAWLDKLLCPASLKWP